jgi:signal peptidase I
MINWWKNSRQLKSAREALRGSRKWLRMNRDLLSSTQIQAITTQTQALEEAIEAGAVEKAMSHTHELEHTIGGALPVKGPHVLVENVEVFLVAVIVAMAVRTFFIQPFKIPTGSMQPTLYGIYPPEPNLKLYEGSTPSMLEMIWGTMVRGRIYKATGYRDRGDHIFVDRFTYHFRKPNRGEVIVFLTDNIPDIPESSRGKFYIKRLIGLGGDSVEISPPYVKVNSQRLEGLAFERMYSMKNDYHGYVLPPADYGSPALFINVKKQTYNVPEQQLFVLGDNSQSSLDGRYWGAVPQRDLVGRAVFVYWPIFGRFGLIN